MGGPGCSLLLSFLPSFFSPCRGFQRRELPRPETIGVYPWPNFYHSLPRGSLEELTPSLTPSPTWVHPLNYSLTAPLTTPPSSFTCSHMLNWAKCNTCCQPEPNRKTSGKSLALNCMYTPSTTENFARALFYNILL